MHPKRMISYCPLPGRCLDHQLHNDHEEESSGVVDSEVLACTVAFLDSICKKFFFFSVGFGCTTVAIVVWL